MAVGARLLYCALADDIEALISRGEYRPFERLPSVRTLHLQRGIAIGTVCQALAELEARGLVEARPRAGYFVLPRRAPAVPKTPPQAMHARPVPLSHVADAFVSASADTSLVPLGGAVLSPSILPIRHLQRIARETLGLNPGV